jgi:hypothetical protein
MQAAQDREKSLHREFPPQQIQWIVAVTFCNLGRVTPDFAVCELPTADHNAKGRSHQ